MEDSSLNLEYYSILGLQKGASDADIKRAYRKLAMKWHPDKNPDMNPEECASKFQLIAESYDVLSDKAKRAVYDQFGYAGLRDGVPDARGNQSGYSFSGSDGAGGFKALEIFQSFFGTANPFADFGFGESTPFTSRLGAQGPKKVDPVVINLACTLEELYNGCTKKLKITRLRPSPEDPSALAPEPKVLSIQVKSGWKSGTKITFPGEGDAQVAGPSGVAPPPPDLVFVIEQTPHSRFAREGGDLVFLSTVSLFDALTDCTVQVPTLDGRTLSIPCPEVVSPGYEKVVVGEGMPSSKAGGAKGNLVIRFKIVFPKFLEESKKKIIRETLSGTVDLPAAAKEEEKKE